MSHNVTTSRFVLVKVVSIITIVQARSRLLLSLAFLLLILVYLDFLGLNGRIYVRYEVPTLLQEGLRSQLLQGLLQGFNYKRALRKLRILCMLST